jgi:phosphoribosyl-AMP cyclohydrolase / phosphoribosyl-ATP pyrophosphohydrolase
MVRVLADDLKLDFAKMDGLIPVIVQDHADKTVLMLGFMNEAAWEKTRQTGLVTFFSRGRQSLWTKGETSGNVLKVRRVLVDCDDDTLLIEAEPKGPTCHTGERSCFYREVAGA